MSLEIETELRRFRKGRATASLLTIPLVLLSFPAIAVLADTRGAHSALEILAMSVTFLLALMSVAAWAFGRKKTLGTLRIDDAGVTIGNEVIPRAAIESAFFAPGARRIPSTVRLVGVKHRLLAEIVVRDHDEATAVLDALQLGVGKRTALFSAMAPEKSRSRRVSHALIGLTIALALSPILLHSAWPIFAAFALLVGSSALFLSSKVVVGADGLLIKTRIAPRFVPWSDVLAVQAFDLGIELVLEKETIRIPTVEGRKARQNPYSIVEMRALFARAKDAFEAYKSGQQVDIAAKVARGGRTHEEWMRALSNREGDFRTAPLLEEQLWNVVESPLSDATARAGAAAVLARSPNADRARLRVAADACTAPKLRVVLDKAASGAPDSDLDSALESVDDDPRTSTTRASS